MATITLLAAERDCYLAMRDQLIAAGELGKYALFGNGHYLGAWENRDEAFRQGYLTCGVRQPFLVKQLLLSEKPQRLTRDIAP